MTSPLDILWPLCSAVDLDRRGPSDWMCGVYFLIRDDEIVYVGQSLDVQARLRSHMAKNVRRSHDAARRFDRAIWMRIPSEHLNSFEGALIKHLNPSGNRGGWAPKQITISHRDALIALGFAS